MSKQNFLKGAAILGAAGLLIKIIGAIYRIPLTNLIGTEGIGHYQPAYQVYLTLLVISLAGFPTAIARLVSEKRAQKNYQGAHQVFQISLAGMFLGGLVTSVVVFLTSEWIASDLLGFSGSYYSMIALTPALLFVPIMSTFRGYFQGMQNMVPTALSQIIEQILRFIVGLYLAFTLLKTGLGLPQAAGGAQFGASAGSIGGTILIVLIYFKYRKKLFEDIKLSPNNKLESISSIIKKLLVIAIPITLGASIVPVMGLIDVKLVSMRLLDIGFTEEVVADLFGQLSGTAQTFINFPQVFSIAVAVSLVPTITHAYTIKNKTMLNRTANLGVRTALLIGLPSAMGLFILGVPIITLFYPGLGPEKHASVGALLQILSISVIFLTLVQSLTAILQAVDKQNYPVKNMAIGAIVKIIISYILLGLPELNIKGAAFSTIAAYLTASILNYIDIKRKTNIEINILKITIRPLLSTIIMSLVVWIIYNGLFAIVGMKLAAVTSIFAGVVVYAAALFKTGALTEEDLMVLPRGKRFIKILKKAKLLR